MASEISRSSAPNDGLSEQELILAQTAFYLEEKGDIEAATLLLDAESIHFSENDDSWGGKYHWAYLNVPGWTAVRFDDALLERIQEALKQIGKRYGLSVTNLELGAALPSVDQEWRRTLYTRLSGDSVTNHAKRVKPDPRLSRDGFYFMSLEEIRVYDALKRAQAALYASNPANTISIFPLPLGRVGTGNVWTPDFLVVREGRAVLIEVDGPQHRARVAADRTRDRQWENSGFVKVERIPVEETSRDEELDHIVRTYLERLIRR
ncbi:hypothetical protein [Microbispora sp. GKU 823]|uniref:hypothetical protein n=1 Tax=Microbispora sp. GKU 823 TaxID=1652100 RepID=UPI001180FA0F|nr:hypothetical protein [Microbispora sp. GKU 823]